ncbi:hypothetical protein [Halalkalibacter wakoensis]|nr:hypothetical protein [Halalkalibacter wakoensis]
MIEKEKRLKYVSGLFIGLALIYMTISLEPDPIVRSLDDIKIAYDAYTEAAANIPETETDDLSWYSTWDHAYSTLETEMLLFYTEESYFDRLFRADILPSVEELDEFTKLQQQIETEHTEHLEKALHVLYDADMLHSHFTMLEDGECVEENEVTMCQDGNHYSILLEETVYAAPYKLQAHFIFKDVLLLVGQSSNYFLLKDEIEYTPNTLEARYKEITYTIDGNVQMED